MNLILIGYRGTGKSTVASLLAEHLAWKSLDADEQLQRLAGCSIAQIFAQHGETHFRDLESKVLTDLLQEQNRVISTGGGVILRESNRALLGTAGKVIWLRAEPTTIQRRLAADQLTTTQRPNLTPQGGLAEIVDLLKQRTPLYQQCADLVVDTDGKTPAEITQEILRALGKDFTTQSMN